MTTDLDNFQQMISALLIEGSVPDDDTLRFAKKTLDEFLRTAPDEADALGLSVAAYFLGKMYGQHGGNNRTPLSLLDTSGATPMHGAAHQTSKAVALLAPETAVTMDGEIARLSAITEPHVGNGPQASTPYIGEAMTAFLATDSHIITAGHAVSSLDIRNMRLVFGYDDTSPYDETANTYQVPRKNVFQLRKLISLINDRQLGDVSVIEIYPPVHKSVAEPVRFAPKDSVRTFQEVAMITHALGEPLTVVTRKQFCNFWSIPVLLELSRNFLHTNLDTYQGCSGSPVVDKQGRVVGVHANGERAFNTLGEIKKYPEMDAGSHATRIEIIADVLEAIGTPLPKS